MEADVLRRAVALCEEMLALADHGDAMELEAEVRVLLGVIRDSAYRIRREARRRMLTSAR